MGFAFALKKLVGFAARKANYAERLGVRDLPKLKLVGTSKNGTKVYKGAAENGKQYTVSFKKDGSPLKMVEKRVNNIKKEGLNESIKETIVKNYEKNEGVFLRRNNAEVRTDMSWLGRYFKAGDKVKIAQKTKYNDKNFGYEHMVDDLTTYTQAGNSNWKWTVHTRPGIIKSSTYNKYSNDWQQTETYFALNNFKFPNGEAVHNGTVARIKGVSPFEGKFDKSTRAYTYAAPLEIDYKY